MKIKTKKLCSLGLTAYASAALFTASAYGSEAGFQLENFRISGKLAAFLAENMAEDGGAPYQNINCFGSGEHTQCSFEGQAHVTGSTGIFDQAMSLSEKLSKELYERLHSKLQYIDDRFEVNGRRAYTEMKTAPKGSWWNVPAAVSCSAGAYWGVEWTPVPSGKDPAPGFTYRCELYTK